MTAYQIFHFTQTNYAFPSIEIITLTGNSAQLGASSAKEYL
jgi:hypothetical protein